MALTTVSSREFNQDIMRAKRAAESGPVVITVRGNPAHVLLSIEEYKRLTRKKRSILDAIATHASSYVDFEPPRLELNRFGVEFTDVSA